jgi:hypothetical protein
VARWAAAEAPISLRLRFTRRCAQHISPIIKSPHTSSHSREKEKPRNHNSQDVLSSRSNVAATL